MIDRLRSVHRWFVATSTRLAWLPPLVARVAVGAVFVSTGWGKLHNLDRVIEFFESLGIPAAAYQAPFVAMTEFGCGLLLVAGVATRFVAIPLIGTMVVAIGTALWPDLEGVLDLFGREEFLFIVLLGWLVIAGAGAVSVDGLVTRRA